MPGRQNDNTGRVPTGRYPSPRGLWAVCLIGLAIPAASQPVLTLSDAAVDVGADATLLLSLESAGEPVSGIRVEFVVPANIAFTGAAAAGGLAEFTAASYAYMNNGVQRGGFVAYSGRRTIDPGQALASVTFTVDGVAAGTVIPIEVVESWLSNSGGTALVAHGTADGSITVGAGGEGEGEGEGDTLAEIAQMLFDGFSTGDANADGTLSFDEASGIRPSLTQQQFAAIDTDGNGQITMQELLDAGAVGPGGPSCCDPGKRLGLSDIREYLGDLALLGLALLVLGRMGSLAKKP